MKGGEPPSSIIRLRTASGSPVNGALPLVINIMFIVLPCQEGNIKLPLRNPYYIDRDLAPEV